MSKKKQLKTAINNNIVNIDTTQQITPIQAAMASGASPEELLKFMELQERYDANEAKKSYSMAVADFKAEDIYIPKDMENSQFGSRYSSKSILVNTVNPYLSKHGLSARWDLKKDDLITVTCILSHKNGHSESVSFDAPADTSGKKNPIQEMKSTITYLEIITFEAITGVSSSDGSNDDDGNSFNQAECINEDQALTIHATLSEGEVSVERFESWLRRDWKCDGIDGICVDNYEAALAEAKQAVKSKAQK